MQMFRYDKPVVLTIDDDADVLQTLGSTLTGAGYSCHQAADGRMALKAARSVSPDLIVCDINLGGESGLELIEEIKEQADLGDVPVMFLSGAQIPDVIRRAHAAGGTYYLRKPFDPGVLLELADKAMWMPHLVKAQLSS